MRWAAAGGRKRFDDGKMIVPKADLKGGRSGRRPPPQAAAMGSVSDGNSMHAGERRGKGSAPKGKKRNPALGLSPPYKKHLDNASAGVYKRQQTVTQSNLYMNSNIINKQ